MKISLDSDILLNLVEDAHNGKLVLPRFQRSFVWAYADVIDFLQSIFRRYFIGTLLFQDCDKNDIPFDYRSVEGVNIPKEMLKPEKLILDGQQRITTLHYVLYAPEKVNLKYTSYPYRFFLDLKKLQTEDIDDDAIFGDRENKCKRYYDITYQYENRIIPFTVLQSYLKWSEWQTGFEKWLIEKDREEYFNYSQGIKPLWTQYINNFFLTFSVPIVEINKMSTNDEKGLSEVCAIFEKMNTTGVKLSIFDLLTARLYKDKIDLRQLWEDSLVKYHLLAEFSNGETDIYGVFILRIIGLIRDIETKSKKLINLKPSSFVEDWENASYYLEKALERITFVGPDGFGVFDKYWLPYPPMLPVMAATLLLIDSAKLGDRGYSVLKKWYWGAIFTERFQSAVESKTTADYKSIKQAIVNNDLSGEIFNDIDTQILNNENFTLKKTNRINAMYKGVMNMLALNGAKDISLQDNIALHELDDHHIFPVQYLKDTFQDIKSDDINVVLNKTLLHKSTNRKIGKRNPSDYLNDPAIINQESKMDILELHLMDTETVDYLLDSSYENFINSRDKYIVNKIKNILHNT